LQRVESTICKLLPYQQSNSPVEVICLPNRPHRLTDPCQGILTSRPPLDQDPNVNGRSDGRSFLCAYVLVPNAPSPLHQIMTLAGVAQSVERVALINSKEINLKVVGSSPTFGYSYITSFNMKQLFFCTFWVAWEVSFWSGTTGRRSCVVRDAWID
jgi:hypothetical protein